MWPSSALRWMNSAAQVQAQAGVDIVAPSDMMDGRIGAIRTALEADLQAQAIARFQAKAQSVAQSFGFKAYQLVQVNVGAVAELLLNMTIAAALGPGETLDPDFTVELRIDAGAGYGAFLGYVGPRMKQYAMGESLFLKELEKGSASELNRRAIGSGLKFSFEKSKAAGAVEEARDRLVRIGHRSDADHGFGPLGQVVELAHRAQIACYINRLRTYLHRKFWYPFEPFFQCRRQFHTR